MPQLTDVRLIRPEPWPPGFPFDLPVVRSFPELRMSTPVTIFVGENGSGKSTVLEALAMAARATTAGTFEASDDPSLARVRALASSLRLGWSARTHRGFYVRAEDFFGYAKRVSVLTSELEADLAAVDAEYEGRPGLAHDLARTPFTHELDALRRRYGSGLDERSHGESFLHFFQERIVPDGVYFLDEPEAPLSPMRQLGLLALIRHMVEAARCQVIMATHSPILLAFPGATILGFDQEPIGPVDYATLEHVRLTRDFLADPQAFLRHL